MAEGKPESKLMTSVKWWLDRVVGVLTAIALGIAGWAMVEVISLKVWAGRTETRMTASEKALADALKELRTYEADVGPKLEAHDGRDEQRDIELRNRISRAEAMIDKLTDLSERWAIAENNIAWIRNSLEGKKP